MGAPAHTSGPQVVTASQSAGPPISVKATGVILNPWYDLPIVLASSSRDGTDGRRDITSSCRIDLGPLGIELFFERDQMVFFFADKTSAPRSLINPIRYFVTYRTFINYNAIGFAGKRPDGPTLTEQDRIRFNLEEIVRIERDDPTGAGKLIHHEGRQASLELPVINLVDYLRVLNPTLYYAVTFYLIGCENHRYFLVEFYKAIEVITNAFGGESSFLEALKPHGIMRAAFKEFGKVSNDMRLAPLDIGRHAPMPGAPIYAVDLRNMLVEPRSREVFESSSVFCRNVIDAYITFLVQKAPRVSGSGLTSA